MYNKIIIVLVILLKVNHVLSAGDKAESSASQDVIPTLPLVLIKRAVGVEHPSQLVIPVWTNQGQTLSGGTIFSHGQSRNTVYLCAREPFTNKARALSTISPENDDRYCSYPTEFQHSEPLQCTHYPEPFVEEIRIPGEPTISACGPGGRGKAYRFVYKSCFEENVTRSISFMDNRTVAKNIKNKYKSEIYRFCMNEQHNEITYTRHRTLSPYLLDDDNLQQERLVDYPTMTDGYGTINSYVEKTQVQYLMLDDPSYKIQKLVPADDLAFALWRKAAFHILNTRPMRKNLAELWNYINNRILRSATKDKIEYDIYTAALSSYDQEDEPATQNVSKVPNVWLKFIVHYYITNDFGGSLRVDSLVIMVADNVDENFVENFFQGECEIDLCENAFSHRFHDDITKSVRCCNLTSNIQELFDVKNPSHGQLNTDFLFDQSDD